MGNFYTNYTLRGPSQQDVAQALTGRTAIVSPVHKGCVVVYDEESEQQDTDLCADLAARLSTQLRCPVLAVLNHDDDILWYRLYERGELSDEYNSTPGYFDGDAEPSAPSGGDAKKLCAAFGATDAAAVEAVLRKSSDADDGYTFAVERHADLVRAVGLPEFAVGTGYTYLEGDEYPEGLSPDDIVETS